MKDYQCSCHVEYPNESCKFKNGKWKCVDKYEKVEDWKPKGICSCKTHCKRKNQTDSLEPKNEEFGN